VSLRDRAEDACAAAQTGYRPAAARTGGGRGNLAVAERRQVDSAVRHRVRRWCRRLGVAEPPADIALEKRFSAEPDTAAGWFRFAVEDIEFLARADSTGRFDVFLAGGAPDDGPIHDLADLGRALARHHAGA